MVVDAPSPLPAVPKPKDAGDGYTSLLCTTPSEVARCMAIRFAVFVVEQQYGADVEVDEKDPHSDHLLLISPSGEDIGTVRLYPPMAKLGRLAVHSSTRGTGAGKRMMDVLEAHVLSGEGKVGAYAREQKGKKAGGAWEKEGEVCVQANVQKYAEGFYKKCGYSSEGEDFLEEGQPHVKMTKVMQLASPSSQGVEGKPYIHLCTTDEEVERAWAIRVDVFINEQGFPLEDEKDEKDPTSDHLLLISPNGEDMGTIRFHPPTGKLGRLAVLKAHRGTGAGRLLVEALEDHVAKGRAKGGVYARERGLKEVEVEAMAQHQAQGFYERCGYTRVGDQVMEDNYPHVRMLKTVKIEQ